MAQELDVNYLEEVAGQGFENIGSNETTVPRLLIAQSLSDVVTNEKVPVGHFYNSVTGEDYGTSVDVIVCHFQKVWVEWKPNQGGYVGTYPVGGLEGVTGDNFKGMTHVAEDGSINKVVETWYYLVILPEHKEAGFMIFGSTPGNMKYLKGWNTQLMYLRTPGGKPAPIFAGIWNMTSNKDKSKNGNPYYSCNSEGKSSIVFKEWTSKELFLEYVQPARQMSDSALLLVDNREETTTPMIEDDNADY